jgi:uncharacterized protein YyaL (SSP411 family)
MVALGFAEGPTQEVVVAGDAEAEDTRRMLETIDRTWAPNAVLIHRVPGTGTSPVMELAPFTADQVALDGRATAYVCRRHACIAPTTDVESLRHALGPAGG